MPTCPNCGEILMTGDPYCSHCGTIIRWYDDEDDEDDDSSDEFDVSEFVDSEILIDLYNRGFSFAEVLNMQKDVNEFSNDFSCKLIEAQIHNGLVLFIFLKEEKYWSVILRAGYNPSDPVKRFNFHEDIFEGNFEKLYGDEKFRELIRKEENERNIEAKRCELYYFRPNIFMVSVIFNNCEAELDLDTMSLKSWIFY